MGGAVPFAVTIMLAVRAQTSEPPAVPKRRMFIRLQILRMAILAKACHFDFSI